MMPGNEYTQGSDVEISVGGFLDHVGCVWRVDSEDQTGKKLIIT